MGENHEVDNPQRRALGAGLINRVIRLHNEAQAEIASSVPLDPENPFSAFIDTVQKAGNVPISRKKFLGISAVAGGTILAHEIFGNPHSAKAEGVPNSSQENREADPGAEVVFDQEVLGRNETITDLSLFTDTTSKEHKWLTTHPKYIQLKRRYQSAADYLSFITGDTADHFQVDIRALQEETTGEISIFGAISYRYPDGAIYFLQGKPQTNSKTQSSIYGVHVPNSLVSQLEFGIKFDHDQQVLVPFANQNTDQSSNEKFKSNRIAIQADGNITATATPDPGDSAIIVPSGETTKNVIQQKWQGRSVHYYELTVEGEGEIVPKKREELTPGNKDPFVYGRDEFKPGQKIEVRKIGPTQWILLIGDKILKSEGRLTNLGVQEVNRKEQQLTGWVLGNDTFKFPDQPKTGTLTGLIMVVPQMAGIDDDSVSSVPYKTVRFGKPDGYYVFNAEASIDPYSMKDLVKYPFKNKPYRARFSPGPSVSKAQQEAKNWKFTPEQYAQFMALVAKYYGTLDGFVAAYKSNSGTSSIVYDIGMFGGFDKFR